MAPSLPFFSRSSLFRKEGGVISAAHHAAMRRSSWPVAQLTGVTLVGSGVQNNDGVLSGFTASSYAKLPFFFTAGATSLEAVCRFTCNGWTSGWTDGGIWGCVGSTNAFTPFYLPNQKTYISAYISSNGSSWNVSNPLDSPYVAYVSPITGTHLLKIVYSSSEGYRQYRFENGGWTLCGSIANTAAPYGSATMQPHLGNNRGQSAPLNGSIDLKFTYLMRDGSLLWEGVAGAYRNVATMR
jgi:hypothetical protein